MRRRSLLTVLLFILVVACPAFSQTAPQQLVSEVKHAVVIVTSYDKDANQLQQGTGFFIASDRIVTNFHVIDSAQQIQIKTFSGEYAIVEGVDRQGDLAILHLATPFPDTASLQVTNLAPTISVSSTHAGWTVNASELQSTWNFERLGLHITASLKTGNDGPVVNLQADFIGDALMDINAGTYRD
ncbi:MAG TPA: S1C family serine protease [Pyrinomonadaceae bacterium]